MSRFTMETARAIVRPLLTLSGWAVALIMAFQIPSIRDRVVDAALLYGAFWFGSRGKEK